jgi:hypothetical protein
MEKPFSIETQHLVYNVCFPSKLKSGVHSLIHCSLHVLTAERTVVEKDDQIKEEGKRITLALQSPIVSGRGRFTRYALILPFPSEASSYRIYFSC